jgi:hypothetical protein
MLDMGNPDSLWLLLGAQLRIYVDDWTLYGPRAVTSGGRRP